MRRLRRADAETIAQWMNDIGTIKKIKLRRNPEVELSVPTEEDIAGTIDWMNERCDVFGIEEEGRLVGYVGFRPMIKPLSREIGILIGDPVNRRKGTGTRALKEILHYGFSKLGLDEVTAEVFGFNDPAMNIFDKTGFKRAGLSEERTYYQGKYYEIPVLRMQKEEYLLLNPCFSQPL